MPYLVDEWRGDSSAEYRACIMYEVRCLYNTFASATLSAALEVHHCVVLYELNAKNTIPNTYKGKSLRFILSL